MAERIYSGCTECLIMTCHIFTGLFLDTETSSKLPVCMYEPYGAFFRMLQPLENVIAYNQFIGGGGGRSKPSREHFISVAL
jgi:hypothetical protein